jgi:hypothetical protein
MMMGSSAIEVFRRGISVTKQKPVSAITGQYTGFLFFAYRLASCSALRTVPRDVLKVSRGRT